MSSAMDTGLLFLGSLPAWQNLEGYAPGAELALSAILCTMYPPSFTLKQ